MSELTRADVGGLSNNKKVSFASLFARANNQPKEFTGLNPYYHHIQCKCGTSGHFDIFKPVQPTEDNKDNKLEILNPDVVASHRIIGIEGDLIELKFGFAQTIMKALDIEEGENKYVRCQTTKAELYDYEGNVVQKVVDNKPLPTAVFSPKKSNKEPRQPNPALLKELGGGYTNKLFGQVDPKYAERVGIPNVRSCVDCVRAGTNIFVDKAPSPDKPGAVYECKMTGEMIVLVRRVAYKAQDPNNLMKSIIKWVDISELGSEHLNKPCVFVIPLSRGDMFNKVGGDYGYHYNLNKLDYPKSLQPIGMMMDQIQKYLYERIVNDYTFEDIGVTAPLFYATPIQLMLAPLTLPIGAGKNHAILGHLVPNDEVQKDAVKRAEHAWYVYTYEKGLANGNLDVSSEYPTYNPVYNTDYSLEPSKEVEPTKEVTQSKSVDSTDSDDDKFWSALTKTSRQES